MDMVKLLREKTQVGMMDCKKALEEASGDMEKAIEILRKKGTAVAAKRAENVTNNGRIECFIAPDYSVGALVEIACETDFSAKTPNMEMFANDAAQVLARHPLSTADAILAQKSITNPSITVNDHLNDLIAKIAEKIQLNNIARFHVEAHGVVNTYIHPGSTVGVMVELTAEKPCEKKDELATIARDICMQIAVNKPIAVAPKDLDPALIEKEREIAKELLKTSNKPANVIEKIIDGKINKFYEEVCLTHQAFIKNDKVTIKQHLEEVSKKLNNIITVKQFIRFGIGR